MLEVMISCITNLLPQLVSDNLKENIYTGQFTDIFTGKNEQSNFIKNFKILLTHTLLHHSYQKKSFKSSADMRSLQCLYLYNTHLQ